MAPPRTTELAGTVVKRSSRRDGRERGAPLARCTVCNTPFFDCVQATWNVCEPSAGGALAAARAAGMDVIVKEARDGERGPRGVARTTLRPSAPPPPPQAMANGRVLAPDARGARALRAAADARGTTVDALALAVAMAQPFAPMVLSGAATVSHLEANADALRVAESLAPADAAALVAACAVPPEEYWAARGALAWN